MILHLSQCISAIDLQILKEAIAEVDFHDGQATAGSAAKQVKHNQQADKAQIAGVLRMIEQRLLNNDVFIQATQPHQLVRLILSRYRPGMRYGSHMDEALIDGKRTDISFTLFLSPKESYQGGELVIEDTSGERSWKLDEGDMLLYPSTYLHRVDEVTEGERLVVVGWITSRIRNSQQRELLFDLELAMREEFSARGKTAQYDRLSRVRNNLLRQWLDS